MLALVLSLLFQPGHPTAKFSAKVATVAGTASDVMIVRHLVVRGTNEQIGAELAKIAMRDHDAKLVRLDPQTEKQRNKWFERNYPELMARAAGVKQAEGQGADLDYTSLPYDFDIKPGCSVVYYPPSSVSNHHAMLSRNYDFPKGSFSQFTGRKPADPDKPSRSATGDPYIIEMHPDRGYASLYVTAYDLLGAVDGINEKGVSVALLADDMSPKKTRGTPYVGLGEVSVPRYVLDKAGSAKEARRLLEHAAIYAVFNPIHYIVSDATGDSFIFEVDEHNVHHFFENSGKPQIVTNHAIFKYGTDNLPSGNSFDRYKKLQAQLAERHGKVTPKEVKEINYCVAVPGSVGSAATMWHAVYDLTDRSVKVSFCLSRAEEKIERRTPYLSFRLSSAAP